MMPRHRSLHRLRRHGEARTSAQPGCDARCDVVLLPEEALRLEAQARAPEVEPDHPEVAQALAVPAHLRTLRRADRVEPDGRRSRFEVNRFGRARRGETQSPRSRTALDTG